MAAEAEGIVRELTGRLDLALPEDDLPEEAWLDKLSALRHWGKGTLCQLRYSTCFRPFKMWRSQFHHLRAPLVISLTSTKDYLCYTA